MATAADESLGAVEGLTFVSLPPEVRNMIYRYVVDGKMMLQVASTLPCYKFLVTEDVKRLKLLRMIRGNRATLTTCISLLRLNHQIHTEVEPIIYANVCIKMYFESARLAYSAINRFIDVSSPVLRSQLKYLDFQFRIMHGCREKEDKESLRKALTELPNLETLTLSSSNQCVPPSRDSRKKSSDPRWMPITLRRLQVAMTVLPQLEKAFFINCAEHPEEGFIRHPIRLTGRKGAARERVSCRRTTRPKVANAMKGRRDQCGGRIPANTGRQQELSRCQTQVKDLSHVSFSIAIAAQNVFANHS